MYKIKIITLKSSHELDYKQYSQLVTCVARTQLFADAHLCLYPYNFMYDVSTMSSTNMNPFTITFS